MILEHKRITIRGLLKDAVVHAVCCGDWAVHRRLDDQDYFCITLLPLGLSLPYAWASFTTPEHAIAAMKSIARMKNSWAQITQQDLTKNLGDQLQAICLRFGAVEGPAQWSVPADKNIFGLPIKERVNGYRNPGV